jgi:hypothetical protein
MENKNQKSKSKSNSKSNEDTKKNKNDVEKINVKLTKNVKDNKKENKKDNNIIFIIVERNGTLKETEIKENQISPDEVSKKCKFKKPDGFIKRTQWNYSSKNSEENSSSKIIIELWAKDDGIANYENKYEFPPPVDNVLFFGCCALIAKDNKNNYVNLKKEKWNKIYEYLFGGFESLVGNEEDDEDEEDELDSIPSNRKTRDGYLKDGFVVEGGAGGDSDIEEESDDSDDSDDDDDTDSDDDSNDGDVDGDGDGDGDGERTGEGDEDCDDGAEDTYSKKKNKTNLVKNKIMKNKPKGRNTKEDDDDDNSGWKTDDSSELSEEEYTYSK